MTSPVPSDVAYSPTAVAVTVAEGLAKLGHEISFFGPEGTQIPGVTTETVGVKPLIKNNRELYEMITTTDLFQDYLPSLYDQYMVRAMFERASAGEFDALVFHHPESAIGFAKLFPKVPVLYILHDAIDEKRRHVIEMNLSPNQHFVSISNSQRRDAPDLPYIETVYNGIDTNLFEFSSEAEDYLMYAGRIVPEKGVKEAVQVALQTGRRLMIAGQVLPTAQWYFDEHIKPYLNDRILYLGTLDKEQLVKYYQKAAALLVPISWEEPFGLTMAEAMSCGTPIIAFRRGSIPEVIEDNKTGFIVNNTSEMVEMIENLPKLNRQDCRKHVENNFTTPKMVGQYEDVLHRLINNLPPKGVQPKPKTLVRLISDKIVEQLR